jgi:hypothetical protein
LEFERASPAIICPIRRRELLNRCFALYARGQSLLQLEDYKPKRLGEERPVLLCYSDLIEFGRHGI